MSTHSIEAGQRLKMQAGDKSGFVQVLAEAVVPAGYWICREELSGKQSIISRTALFPIAADPATAAPAEAPGATTPTAA